MARPKKRNEDSKGAAQLIEALKFVACSQRELGTPYQQHCRIYDGVIVAYDGVIAAGHMLDEVFTACPHTLKFLNALSKCGDELSITQLDSARLSITSGRFRALVPCVEPGAFPAVMPDPAIVPADDRLRKALETVAPLAAENSTQVFTASVLLNGRSCVAGNHHLIAEAWHGLDLPPGLVVPKIAVAALLKINKPFKQFGFSQNSITIYFEDNSWFRSQLYTDKWPNVEKLLNVETKPWPAPSTLWEAVEAVGSFSENDRLWFKDNKCYSHETEHKGASYEVIGVPNISLHCKDLHLVESMVTGLDFTSHEGKVYFFGENVRGVLACLN